MSKIAIFDVSGAVYYGTLGFASSNDTYYGFPVAGIKALLSRVSLELAGGSKVALAFDSRSARKDLCDSYKAKRTPNRNVSAQIEFLYDYLTKIGIPCIKVDGYEADDIIAWYSSEYHNESITIYSNDHDVAHNVHDGIILKPFNTHDNVIRQSNFSDALHYNFQSRTYPIVFNTISAYKVFCGCQSDGISKFKSSLKFITETIYQRYIRFLSENSLIGNYFATSSYKNLAVFFNTVCRDENLITDDERKELFTRIRLIFPFAKPEDVTLGLAGVEDLDLDLLGQLLVACKDYHSIGCLKCNKPELSEQLVDVLRGYAKDLKNGAYSVDRNLEIDPSYEVDSEPMYLKEF